MADIKQQPLVRHTIVPRQHHTVVGAFNLSSQNLDVSAGKNIASSGALSDPENEMGTESERGGRGIQCHLRLPGWIPVTVAPMQPGGHPASPSRRPSHGVVQAMALAIKFHLPTGA